jgi:hypothetical protein
MAKYLILVLSLLVTSCATSQSIPTHTSIPPTYTSLPPTQLPPVIEVTFDGTDCTVTGPTELPAGEHTFIFIDRFDRKAVLWLVNLDDGKTTQDLLDRQSEPGEAFPRPSWIHDDTQKSIESEELEGRRVDTSTWRLDIVGEHTIVCYVHSIPRIIWYPSPLWIVEAPSE